MRKMFLAADEFHIETEEMIMENNDDDNNTTELIETNDYITTAYSSLFYYKCKKCGYDEILNVDNFCPHCGRKVVNWT